MACNNEPKQERASIKEITGDLFTCPANYSMAHCISADVNMGKGIAVMFKKMFGGVQELLDQKQRRGGMAVLERDQRFIYYLVTKENYWKKPSYGTINNSLQEMKKHNLDHGVTHLCMPKIGCGLDRLDWDNVLDIINRVYQDTSIEITIYHYDDNQRGNRRNTSQDTRQQDFQRYPKEQNYQKEQRGSAWNERQWKHSDRGGRNYDPKKSVEEPRASHQTEQRGSASYGRQWKHSDRGGRNYDPKKSVEEPRASHQTEQRGSTNDRRQPPWKQVGRERDGREESDYKRQKGANDPRKSADRPTTSQNRDKDFRGQTHNPAKSAETDGISKKKKKKLQEMKQDGERDGREDGKHSDHEGQTHNPTKSAETDGTSEKKDKDLQETKQGGGEKDGREEVKHEGQKDDEKESEDTTRTSEKKEKELSQEMKQGGGKMDGSKEVTHSDHEGQKDDEKESKDTTKTSEKKDKDLQEREQGSDARDGREEAKHSNNRQGKRFYKKPKNKVHKKTGKRK